MLADETPYRSTALPMETPSLTEGTKVPHLRAWHVCVMSAFVVAFSIWVVNWVINWETTRGRIAPHNRLVWNAFAIHAGPLAGVFYWDHGRNRPRILEAIVELFVRRQRREQLFLTAITIPCFLVLVLPSTGFHMPPLRRPWRALIGIAFVLGVGLWYVAAMVSIALLS